MNTKEDSLSELVLPVYVAWRGVAYAKLPCQPSAREYYRLGLRETLDEASATTGHRDFYQQFTLNEQ